jgi:hypothetical protein
MTARLVLNAISGGSRLLIEALLVIRKGKKQVRRAARLVCRNLIESGLPEDAAKEIAGAYASAGLEVLSVRKMISLARRMDQMED